MFTKILLVLFSVLLISTISHGVHAACSATASLSRANSWQSEGRNYSVYSLTVVNSGTCSLTAVSLSLTLSGTSSIVQVWNLQASGQYYNLTNFGGNLATSSSFNGAGFILAYTSSAPVQVAVWSVSCPSSCPVNNTSPSNSSSPYYNYSNGPFAGQTLPSQELLNSLQLAATEVKREALLNSNDYVFDFVSAVTGVSRGQGGRTVSANRENFPALIGHGVAMTVGFLGPCGINLPHTHPRATEINFLVSGEFQAGFFSENGARFLGSIIKPGMVTVFPQGAIHFEMNTACTPAMFVAAFNSEDPGVQTVASTFFGLPADQVSFALNISNIRTVEDLAAHLPRNPGLSTTLSECRQRCGI